MTYTSARVAALTPNRLIHSTSPYLLQHAHNPVDWYPWGDEALARARDEDRPIFLSIGYAACHWCHVMERESFENQAIAKRLNEHFVSIKVDREERPDLDEIYMKACMLYNQGQGGWPMSVFLTPAGKPFFAGTYFPPDSRWGRPGFADVLDQIARLWSEQRSRLIESADALTDAVDKYSRPDADKAGIPLEWVSQSAINLAQSFDPIHGGLSSNSNKFPPSMAIGLMLREYHRTRLRGQPNRLLIERVELTLDHMARGGIRDHLGGGFARYSTDPQWFVPHFEKMLYDQALIAGAYVQAWQLTGDSRWAEVARDVFDYVLSDLQSVEGGFFSSRDADSEGVEGKYYVWTKDEIIAILGDKNGELFCRFHDVTTLGNWEGRNILHMPRDLPTAAWLEGIAPDELRRILDKSRRRLLAARAQRVPPGLDDKIITSWNGLMIASLAFGGRAFDESRYVTAAARAADFILSQMTSNGRLLRVWRLGKAHTPGFLDDHAFFVEGLLELYAATFEPRWLLEAIRLNDDTIRHFWDSSDGAFFMSADDAEQLIVRSKEINDGALPAGNSVVLMNLIRLATILDSADLKDKADKTIAALAGTVLQSPVGFDRLLMAVDLYHMPPSEVVVVGLRSDPATQALIRTASQGYDPWTMLLVGDLAAKQDAPLLKQLPLFDGKLPVDGRPTAYVCRRGTCSKPMVNAVDLQRALNADMNYGRM